MKKRCYECGKIRELGRHVLGGWWCSGCELMRLRQIESQFLALGAG